MAQVQICEHIHDNGDTCGSPALTGYDFCYFHQRLRFPRHRPGDFEYKLPILDTPHAILMATQHITQAALDGILETRRARFVLSALRLAMATLKAMNKPAPKQSVAKKNGEEKNDLFALSSRAPLLGEGSALVSQGERSAPCSPCPDSSGDRGRAGLQPRVAGPEKVGALAPVAPAPAETTDKKPPLSATQLKLMKKILRRGPSHPRFATAARLLDREIVGAN